MAERVRRRRWAVGILAAAALALAGCGGVPNGGGPVVDPGAPQGALANCTGQTIASADVTAPDPVQFIEDGLLTSVAGQTSAKQQVASATAFGTPTAAWAAALEKHAGDAILPVNVVRVVAATATGAAPKVRVKLDVEMIGVFDPAAGEITPSAPGAAPKTLTYDLTGEPGTWHVATAPDGLYVLDSVFAITNTSYYTAQTIYFWSTQGGMVPDLRYLSNALSNRQQVTDIVDWILAGPPKWMGPSVTSIVPSGTILNDPFVTQQAGCRSSYEVNLKQAQPIKQAAEFAAQVEWSITPTGVESLWPIELLVNSTKKDLAGSALTMNQAYQRSDSPIAYAVSDDHKVNVVGEGSFNGALLTASGLGASNLNDGALVVPPKSAPMQATLASPQNSDVMYGALHESRGEVDAAFVRSIGGASPTLWISRSVQGKPNFTQITLPAGALGQPVWIPTEGDALAIADGGKLYVVTEDDDIMPMNVPGIPAIKSFSVSSDGQRIAYVSADGNVYVGVLRIKPTSNTPAGATAPREINIRPAVDSATSVAWSSMSTLVVGGPSDGVGTTVEVYTDGVWYQPNVALHSFAGATSQVSAVSCYPFTPLAFPNSPVLAQTTSGAYAGRSDPKLVAGSNPFFGD